MEHVVTLEEALRELESLRKELVGVKDLKNGSNLIVVDEKENILIVREKTRKQMWMLPGGEVDRGEAPRHAAQSETEEETGLLTDEADFRFIGSFVQRPKGMVMLYETTKFTGEISIEGNSEVSEARFMSFEEIISRVDEFRTAYLRMIVQYMRCKNGIDPIPYEGRLSDRVEYPRNLKGGSYREIVLSV